MDTSGYDKYHKLLTFYSKTKQKRKQNKKQLSNNYKVQVGNNEHPKP